MSRLLGDHRQNKKAQFAVVEQAAAAMPSAMRMPMVSVVGIVMTQMVICGTGGMAAPAAGVFFSHDLDIYLDISTVKIYRQWQSPFL
jgi:hypothetical protein